MLWDEQNTLERFETSCLDRLNMAGALLGATGWIDHLARLVAIDTAPASGEGYPAFAEVLQDLFAPLGFALRSVEVPKGGQPGEAAAEMQPNLMASRFTGRPVCSILCHMDTAPAGEGWTRPPLALTRQGSQLFGRGTVDMKGAIIALWAALRSADAVGLPLRFDPLLIFTARDAEGDFPGLRHFAEQGLLEGHALCLNGSAVPRVWAGCLGQFDLEIRVQRSAVRAGARAAALAMRRILAELGELQGELVQRSSELPASPERGGGRVHPSLSILSVGAAEQDGPQPFCRLLVRRRFSAGEGFQGALEELGTRIACGSAAGKPGGCSVEYRVLRRLDPVTEPDQGPNWPAWQRALSWGFGFAPENFRRWGGADGAVLSLVQQAGLREILLGGLLRPGQRRHGPDEHTTVEDVEALARSVLAYLAEVPEMPDPC